MKILVIGLDKLGTAYGGGQVYFFNLVTELRAKKHEVVYLYLSFDAIATPQHLFSNYSNIKELQLVMPRDGYINNNDVNNPNIINELTVVFKTLNPDIIHANAWKDTACISAKKADIPCVVTAHHGGIVCPRGALLNQREEICKIPVSYENCIQCCLRDIPGGEFWLPFLKSLPVNIQLPLGRWLRKNRFIYFLTPLGTMALSIADKLRAVETIAKYPTLIVAPSNVIADALIRNGVRKEKIAVVSHGITLPQKQPLRPDFGKGPMRFIFVGRVSYVKGVHVMLEAFSQLKKDAYVLYIVGGAVTKPEIRYMAHLKRKYKSLNVVWYGNKPHQEVPKYIAECDVLIHPTISLEVYGLNISEALAVGRPVIATRCGGAEAQIRDGINGLLVSPNDTSALYLAIKYAIDNPTRLKEMTEQTGNVVSIEQHVHDLEKAYTMITDNRTM